jgi:hypothetical protein
MSHILFVFILRIALYQSTSFAGTVGDHLSLDGVKEKCVKFSKVRIGSAPFEGRECKVTEFGSLGRIDGTNYFFALYCILPNRSAENSKCGDGTFDAKFHAQRGMAVFSSKEDANKTDLDFERADSEIGSRYYNKPEIVDVGNRKLLSLSIRIDGTGAGNESEYYVRQNSKWIQIESESWEKQVLEQIPVGLKIYKGIWPDLKTMKAEAGLYKKGDSNCCPTGGRALIDLELVENQIRVKKLIFEPSQGSQ